MYVGLNISCKVSIYIDIAMCIRRHVSSPMLVVCLFWSLTKFLWLCLRLETSLTEKDRTRKKKVAEYIHFRGVDCWKSNCKRESVCCLWKSQCKRVSSWKKRVCIGNLCHAVGSKCARQNQSCKHSCEL